MVDFLTALSSTQNETFTENGALTNSTSSSPLVDLFSSVGSLRAQTDSDIVSRFRPAFAQDPILPIPTPPPSRRTSNTSQSSGASPISSACSTPRSFVMLLSICTTFMQPTLKSSTLVPKTSRSLASGCHRSTPAAKQPCSKRSFSAPSGVRKKAPTERTLLASALLSTSSRTSFAKRSTTSTTASSPVGPCSNTKKRSSEMIGNASFHIWTKSTLVKPR